jgi:hypothetical protein
MTHELPEPRDEAPGHDPPLPAAAEAPPPPARSSRRRVPRLVWLGVVPVVVLLGLVAVAALFNEADSRRAEDRVRRSEELHRDTLAQRAEVTGGDAGSTLQAAGFVIGVPPGWEGRVPAQGEGSTIKAILTGQSNGRRVVINVAAQEGAGPGSTLDALESTTVRGMSAAVASFQKLATSVDITVAGVPGRRFDYLLDSPHGPSKGRAAFFIHNGSAYLVSFASLAEDFDAEVKAMDAALAGWRFTD